MPPRKPRVASRSAALGQETSPEESQEAGSKVVPKRKLDDGMGDVSTAPKRGRTALVQPRTTGGFKNPFAALVPPESIPPHPPQSFDAMLPQDQRYDAYMRPIDPALEAPHELAASSRPTSTNPLSTAFTTPDGSCLSSAAPKVSASNRRGAGTLTEPTTGTRVAIPRWLTDTITRLENELKGQKAARASWSR